MYIYICLSCFNFQLGEQDRSKSTRNCSSCKTPRFGSDILYLLLSLLLSLFVVIVQTSKSVVVQFGPAFSLVSPPCHTVYQWPIPSVSPQTGSSTGAVTVCVTDAILVELRNAIFHRATRIPFPTCFNAARFLRSLAFPARYLLWRETKPSSPSLVRNLLYIAGLRSYFVSLVAFRGGGGIRDGN